MASEGETVEEREEGKKAKEEKRENEGGVKICV